MELLVTICSYNDWMVAKMIKLLLTMVGTPHGHSLAQSTFEFVTDNVVLFC